MLTRRVNPRLPSIYGWAVDADPLAERLRAADLDRYLATLYAPAEARASLFALYALDLELAEVVRTTTQPMVGLIRLAWWREALEKLDRAPPPAQPLLIALAKSVLPRGVTGAFLSGIEAGFAALLEDPVDLYAYVKGRGATLFAAAAVLSGDSGAGARNAGRIWAAAELLRMERRIDREALRAFASSPLAARTKPLRGLAELARRDLRDGPGRRGSPSRQVRLLWSILRPGT